MKKIIYILVLLIPVAVYAQNNFNKLSPLVHIWMNVGNPGFSQGETSYTNLAISPSGEPYVVFTDYWNNKKATVMKFDGIGWVNVGNAGFSEGEARYTNIVFSTAGEPYVVFEDKANYGATVMKFNSSSWQYVGSPGLSASDVLYTSMAFGPDGQPYVAYEDFAYSFKATVRKFNGTSWVNVGSPGFSPRQIEYTSIAFSPSGQPYVAFEDYGNYSKATVMMFDGSNWVNLGPPGGFSTLGAYYINLAFSPSGVPYVAFADDAYGSGASVMKLEGSSWVNVGNPNFSGGLVNYPWLAFSPSGEPYVVYADQSWGGDGKASVMRYTGGSWSYVAGQGISLGDAACTSIAFSPSGKPYVAYIDYAYLKKPVVMKYDSVFVGINEPEESRLSLYPNPATTNLTIDIKNENGNVKFIEVYDFLGKKMNETQTSKNKIILNIEDYPAGFYILRLKTENSNYISKFSKN